MIKILVNLSLLPFYLMAIVTGLLFGSLLGVASVIKGFSKLHKAKKEQIEIDRRIKRIKLFQKDMRDKGIKVGE